MLSSIIREKTREALIHLYGIESEKGEFQVNPIKQDFSGDYTLYYFLSLKH